MNIEQIKQGHPLSQSGNIVENNIEKLKALFPEIVTEGKIDFKVLQEVLGEEVEEGEEYYRFTWAGKANARREAQKPSTGTLRPAPEKSVDWDTTQNLYIEGDNLEVLKLLQKSYANKVKMIYIDPPYNTGKDFVYKDNYKDNLRNYQEVTGQLDEAGNRLSTNRDNDGRFHSNWLNMMYPRLRLARNLITDNGFVFISIDDSELFNLKKICDEIFGEINFVANPVRRRRKSQANLSKNISTIHEYILIYSKSPTALLKKVSGNIDKSKYKNSDKDPRGAYVTMPCTNKGGAIYSVTTPTGKIITEEWRFKEETYKKLESENRLVFPRGGEGKPRYKLFLKDKLKEGVIPNSWWSDVSSNQEASAKLRTLFDDEVIFDHPKPIDLIKLLLELGTDEDSICLDFFAGSSTTAHAIIEHNFETKKKVKAILVQLPESIEKPIQIDNINYSKLTDIGKERIRRAAKKIAEEHPEKSKDLDLGFKVFKLDTSNIKAWDGNPEELEKNLFDAQDNIKEDRSELDVLYEILLKYGLDLTLPIEEREIEGKTVFNVGLGALFICLGDNLTSKVAQGIGEWKEKLQPKVCRVIFKDSGFTDVEKTNSVQTLKRFGINEVKSI